MNVVCSLANPKYYEQTKLVEIYIDIYTGREFDSRRLQLLTMIKKSIEHLKENKMSYIEHFIFASTHGYKCIHAGLLLILHSLIPSLYPRTGSKLVTRLSKSFTIHRKEIENK